MDILAWEAVKAATLGATLIPRRFGATQFPMHKVLIHSLGHGLLASPLLYSSLAFSTLAISALHDILVQ